MPSRRHAQAPQKTIDSGPELINLIGAVIESRARRLTKSKKIFRTLIFRSSKMAIVSSAKRAFSRVPFPPLFPMERTRCLYEEKKKKSCSRSFNLFESSGDAIKVVGFPKFRRAPLNTGKFRLNITRPVAQTSGTLTNSLPRPTRACAHGGSFKFLSMPGSGAKRKLYSGNNLGKVLRRRQGRPWVSAVTASWLPSRALGA